MRCRRAQSQFDPLRRALTEQITYEAQPEKRPQDVYKRQDVELAMVAVGRESFAGAAIDDRNVDQAGRKAGLCAAGQSQETDSAKN